MINQHQIKRYTPRCLSLVHPKGEMCVRATTQKDTKLALRTCMSHTYRLLAALPADWLLRDE